MSVWGGEWDLYGSIIHGYRVGHVVRMAWVCVLVAAQWQTLRSFLLNQNQYTTPQLLFDFRRVWAFVFQSKTLINLGNRSQQCIAFLLSAFSLETESRRCCCQLCHLLGMKPETNPRWKEGADFFFLHGLLGGIRIILEPKASAWKENDVLFSKRDIWVEKRSLSGSLLEICPSLLCSVMVSLSLWLHRIKTAWQTKYSRLQQWSRSLWHFPKELTALKASPLSRGLCAFSPVRRVEKTRRPVSHRLCDNFNPVSESMYAHIFKCSGWHTRVRVHT